MLRVSDLSKLFGAQKVLDSVSFVLNPGDRAGLAGPNGCGKSTLLQVIAGRLPPDSGHVSVPPGTRIGYLPQGVEEVAAGATVLDAARRITPGLAEAIAEIERTTAVLKDHPDDADVARRHACAVSDVASLGGYEIEARLPEALARLGLEDKSPDSLASELSGGQRAKVALAGLLLSGADLLLLDEPTNHLDIAGLEWLESFLTRSRSAVIMVSHDREFLDRTATHILALDPATHRLTKHRGSYSAYAAEKARQLEAHWAAYRDQEAEVQRMKADVARLKARSQQIQGAGHRFTAGHDHYNRVAKKVARLAKARERRLEKYVASPDRLWRPKREWRIATEFTAPLRGGDIVASLDKCSFAYPSLPSGEDASRRSRNRRAVEGIEYPPTPSTLSHQTPPWVCRVLLSSTQSPRN